MKKRKDDIARILEGEKEPPAPPPKEEQLKIKEGDNYATKEGMRYWGKPEQKVPAPAMTGEEEVRHRSGGKGGAGLSQEEKMDVARVCRIIRSAVGSEEAGRIGFAVQEYAEAERKRLEELRKKYTGKRYYVSAKPEAIEYIAKRLRSVGWY